jgi:hypothetical protein
VKGFYIKKGFRISKELIIVLGIMTMHFRLLPISNESQPILLILGLIIFTRRFHRGDVAILLVVLLFCAVSLIFTDRSVGMRSMVIDGLIILLVPLYLVLAGRINTKKLEYYAFRTLICLSLLSLLFYFVGAKFDAVGLNRLVPITDYSFQPLGQGKGIKLLSAEPGYSAYQIFFLLFVARRRGALLLIIFACIFLFTNRSITLFVLMMVLAAHSIPVKKLFYLLLLTPLILSFQFNPIVRLFSISSTMNVVSLNSIVRALSNYGSTRELSNYLVFMDGVAFVPGGFASWQVKFFDRLHLAGFKLDDIAAFQNFNVAPLKPYSYLFLTLSDLGIFFVVLFVSMIYHRFMRGFTVRSVLLILFLASFSLPSSPIPWFIILVLWYEGSEKSILNWGTREQLISTECG